MKHSFTMRNKIKFSSFIRTNLDLLKLDLFKVGLLKIASAFDSQSHQA